MMNRLMLGRVANWLKITPTPHLGLANDVGEIGLQLTGKDNKTTYLFSFYHRDEIGDIKQQ
jgi:hypothetical protein